MIFSIKDFLSICDQIRSFLHIWLHLMKKSFMENLIFCAALTGLTLFREKRKIIFSLLRYIYQMETFQSKSYTVIVKSS